MNEIVLVETLKRRLVLRLVSMDDGKVSHSTDEIVDVKVYLLPSQNYSVGLPVTYTLPTVSG